MLTFYHKGHEWLSAIMNFVTEIDNIFFKYFFFSYKSNYDASSNDLLNYAMTNIFTWIEDCGFKKKSMKLHATVIKLLLQNFPNW